MKKLLLLFGLLMPLFTLSQQSFKHRVTTTTGNVYIGDISRYLSKKIYFNDVPPGLTDNFISVDLVSKIEGVISKQQRKWILEANPNIVFSAELPEMTNSTIYQKYGKSAGDLIQESANLRLAGFTVGMGTTTLFTAGVFKEMELDTQKKIVIGAGIISLALYVAGEVTQNKAGKQMNKDALTFSAAENGIGIAFNF